MQNNQILSNARINQLENDLLEQSKFINDLMNIENDIFVASANSTNQICNLAEITDYIFGSSETPQFIMIKIIESIF
jgi:soluble P-type ATPase